MRKYRFHLLGARYVGRGYRRYMSEPSVNYLRDLGDLLWTEAQQATSAVGDDFQRGRAFGLYEAVSLMQQQALAFGLSPADIGLDGRDAEHLLNQQ